MDELGRVVYNVCNIVPGGVVVFFPSYEYERVVHSHWEATGFLTKMCAKKRVRTEAVWLQTELKIQGLWNILKQMKIL